MAEYLPKCVLGHRNNKENSEKTVLVHLLVQIINYKKMHGEYKVKCYVLLYALLMICKCM
jgi:hypothetical protein